MQQINYIFTREFINNSLSEILNEMQIRIYLFISSSYIRGTKFTKKKNTFIYKYKREREMKMVDRTRKNIYTQEILVTQCING